MTILGLVVIFNSCSTIFTDQSDCPKGLSLQFRYDKNMSFVNMFHKENDCVTVHVYDSEGNHVTTVTENREVLADEDYQMDIDLPAGDYSIVAYGGLGCSKSSFTLKDASVKSAPGSIDDVYVELNHNDLTSNTQLHNLYHAKQDVSIVDGYLKDTVSMVKNTNNLRIVLQQVQGDALSASDFVFTITDYNALMDVNNDVIHKSAYDAPVTYLPWTSGEELLGSESEEGTPVSVAYAEFSTGRIMVDSGCRLTVSRKDNGETVLSIPLDKYLLLLRSELYSRMSAQEYLDREDEWSMVFFLDSGLRWINTFIVINDWTVRLNHIDM